MAESRETQPLLSEEQLAKHRKSTPLPKRQVAVLAFLLLAEPVTSQCIYPFINQLVRELDITGGDEKKVGYYAGLVESTFFATQAMFVLHWTRWSDHIGRKPVILVGLAGMSVSMICFGASRTFWGLVASRGFVGMLNANTGVMKSIIGDITDSTNIAQGFAIIPISWSVGVTLGPLIGGQLSKPHDRWPNVFSSPFWTTFPYLLPCAVSGAFAALCFVVAAVFLKETVRGRKDETIPSVEEAASLTAHRREDDGVPPLRAVLIRPVILSIANYGAIALVEIALLALMPLFYATPIALGGLGLPPSKIGLILGTLGLLNGCFQFLFFAKAVAVWGPKRLVQFGMSMFIPIFALFPFISLYAKAHSVDIVVWAMILSQLAMLVLVDLAYGSIFIYVSSSAPNNRSLGAVNGMAQIIASVVRAVGPAASTSLFATSLELNWMGGYAVYVFFVVFTAVCLLVTRPLPPRMWPKAEVRMAD
ncbi:MFS general substrate transporter [Fomes fomentarius]|nr:MFS general substrate transporter [Fomes fomentarius]